MTFTNKLAKRRHPGCLLAAVLLSISCVAPPGAPPTGPSPVLEATATPQPFTMPPGVQQTGPAPDLRATTTPGIPLPAPESTATPGPAAHATTIPVTAPPVQKYSYRVVNRFPHDREAYTQGLVFDGGLLYESTGMFGRSSLRRVELATGKVLRKYDLPQELFGEGLAVYGDKLVQLTWTSGAGFVYDKNTFDLLRTFNYAHEGWGITFDGRRLIVSDGTAILRFWDPETFVETGRVEVRDQAGPVARLNEMEFINGEIYANVWQTEFIVRISPDTGRVVGRIDLEGLRRQVIGEPGEVLNGIAYDAAGDRLFVTGKLWPTLFEIKLVP